jgi:hypothetical protein
MKTFRLLALLTVAAVSAVLVAAALPETILAGDAVNYRERMAELFRGRLPYRDFAFEHQPMMLIPLALAWLAGGSASQPAYVVTFAAVSLLSLAGIGVLLVAAGHRLLIEDLPQRWLLVTIPLLPFLLFRNDSFSVLLVLGGLLLAMRGREGGSLIMAVMGVLAKIWPAALGVVSWWRGKRASTVVIAATAAAAIAVNFSPPVQSIVRAGGLHTETVAGSVIGFGRALRGSDLGIVRTATAYIDAPGWTLGINLLVGGAIALLALRAVRTEFSWERCWCLVGALTIGGVLASPFFSTQYVSWFAPFAAIRRQTTWQMLGVSVLSLIVIVGWFRLFDGTIWWWAVLLARNALVIVVGGSLIRAMSLSDRSRRSVEATNTVR